MVDAFYNFHIWFLDKNQLEYLTHFFNFRVLQDQYVFVYDCLLEALISGDTLMTAEEYPEILSEMCQYDNMIQKTKLEEQFDVRITELLNVSREKITKFQHWFATQAFCWKVLPWCFKWVLSLIKTFITCTCSYTDKSYRRTTFFKLRPQTFRKRNKEVIWAAEPQYNKTNED